MDEPKPLKSKRCIVCKKPITTVTKYGEADAFCSSVCCREYFGTALPPKEPGVPVGASA